METLIIYAAQYLYLIIVLGALLYLFRQSSEMRLQILLFAVIALPITYLLAKLGSVLYYDPRPFVVGHFVPLLPHGPDNGFPSDHTLLSAAIASVIFFYHRKLGLSLLLVALLVGIARVLAGIHHMVDIFGSVVIAFLTTWGIFVWIFPKVWEWWQAKRSQMKV